MDDRLRLPTLAYPFAVTGAAAGWLSVELYDNPVTGVAPSHAGGVAALAAAAMGALIGIALQGRCAPRGGQRPPYWALWVAFAVLTGGAASGAVTGYAAFAHDDGVARGALAGVGAGLVLVPMVTIVVAAARRAARARARSVVARADGRGMWAVTAAALAVATFAALPDRMAGEIPVVALAIAGGAIAVAIALLAGDVFALVALRRAARAAEGMDLLERGAEEAEGSVPALDLGLGAEVRAVVPIPGAYRGKGRVAALLLGSVGEARGAVRWALARKAIALAVMIGALQVHAIAAGPGWRVAYHEMLCEGGSALDCGVASAMLREGEIDDLPRAVALGAAAGGLDPHDVGAHRGAAADRRDRPWIAAALLQRACEEGNINSCEPALRAREAAKGQRD